MDPNTTLEQIRHLVAQVLHADEDAAADSGVEVNTREERDQLAEWFDALDSWITSGGFCPDDWQRKAPRPIERPVRYAEPYKLVQTFEPSLNLPPFVRRVHNDMHAANVIDSDGAHFAEASDIKGWNVNRVSPNAWTVTYRFTNGLVQTDSYSLERA